MAKGELTAAEPLLREVQEMTRKTLGNRHPNTLMSIFNLGVVLYEKGDLATAEPLFREVLEAQRETLGIRHPDTLGSIKYLSMLLKAKGGRV